MGAWEYFYHDCDEETVRWAGRLHHLPDARARRRAHPRGRAIPDTPSDPRARPRRRRPPAPGATTSPVSISGTTTTGRDSPSPRSDSAPATADPPSRISPALTAYRWTQGMGC